MNVSIEKSMQKRSEKVKKIEFFQDQKETKVPLGSEKLHESCSTTIQSLISSRFDNFLKWIAIEFPRANRGSMHLHFTTVAGS